MGFQKIGFGQCGLIFERHRRSYIVKVTRPTFHASLWTDFVAHLHIFKAFQKHGDLTVYSYVSQSNTRWWNAHRPLCQEHLDFPLPSMALISERIPPLPKMNRKTLIDMHCSSELKSCALANQVNRECLVGLYLGKRWRVNALLAFTLRNFNLCVAQMEELEPSSTDYAVAIAEAHAVIRWEANVDGYDTEFVLGSESRYECTEDVYMGLGLTPDMMAEIDQHTDLDTLMLVNFRQRTIRV